MQKTEEMLSLDKTIAGQYLKNFDFPWKAVSGIKELIPSLFSGLDKAEYICLKDNVWVHKSAVISPAAYIGAPCIIGKNTEIRHAAFIRSAALIGDGCVVGNSTEIKNAILFDGVQVPHYNYVGDSILGYKAHMGAGAITSNVKIDRSEVRLFCEKTAVPTGLKKLGAILGDKVEVGCNSVLCPGTVIGKNTTVYPLCTVRGTVGQNKIYKRSDCIVNKEMKHG